MFSENLYDKDVHIILTALRLRSNFILKPRHIEDCVKLYIIKFYI